MPVTVRSSVDIDVDIDTAWVDIANLASHVEWMRDAVAINFTTAQRDGAGTEFDCRTRIAGITLTDHMTVTAWDERKRIGVDHTGLVSGSGAITLAPQNFGCCVTWQETLRFPLRFGGVIGEVVAKPMFTALWSANLRSLKQRLERS